MPKYNAFFFHSKTLSVWLTSDKYLHWHRKTEYCQAQMRSCTCTLRIGFMYFLRDTVLICVKVFQIQETSYWET
jgi:hypothetical protein